MGLAQNRLKTVAYPSGDPTPAEGYTYHPGGNRKTVAIGGSPTKTYGYDGAGRLNNDGGRTYDYFPNGNLKQRTGQGTGETYRYDGAGRLVYTQASGAAVYTDYARYNGDGLRLYTDMGKGDTGSIWDVNRSLPVVLFEDTPDGPVFSIYGLGQIARVRVNAQGQEQTAYYHQDGGGSVRAVTDVQGKTLVAYDYAAFGTVRREFIRPIRGASIGLHPPGGYYTDYQVSDGA